jgi:hypothetical protein
VNKCVLIRVNNLVHHLVKRTEETITTEVLSSRNRREKEDRIGESKPFRERTLYIRLG